MVILNKKKTFLYKDGEVKKYEFGIKMYWRMSQQIIICRDRGKKYNNLLISS